MNPRSTRLEIAIDSLEDAIAASHAGADRLEVCGRLDLGGLSPSTELVRRIRTSLPTMPLVVMVREPGGDSSVPPTTLLKLAHQATAFAAEGVESIIFGLTREGQIDEPACRELRQAAGGMSCTFHRAFDGTVDSRTSLETLIELGFRRVLTSGGLKAPIARPDLVAQLATFAAGRIEILPGGGIRANNASQLASIPGIDWLHSSCRREADPTRFCPLEFQRLRAALDESAKDQRL